MANEPSDRRLAGWKEIAAYFGRDDRTVMRWEKDRGLPVHRVPGSGKSSVYAYADELKRWLATTDQDLDDPHVVGAGAVAERPADTFRERVPEIGRGSGGTVPGGGARPGRGVSRGAGWPGMGVGSWPRPRC